MSQHPSLFRQSDPVADWKAFHPEKIPTKGGRLDKLPALFLKALESLEGSKREETESDEARTNEIYPSKYLQILELGCGCGELASSLQLRGHLVHGIDVNEEAIEAAGALTAKNLNTQQRHTDRSNMVILGKCSFEVADVAAVEITLSEKYDFCILQLLLSVVGGKDRRKATLQNAFDALKPKGGGTLYLSCSGVSNSINPNYEKLYKLDANELVGEYGDHSYYSRDDENRVLYVTHHFTVDELKSLLSEVGFVNIFIEQRRETSSRRPNESAYFLYATAVRE